MQSATYVLKNGGHRQFLITGLWGDAEGHAGGAVLCNGADDNGEVMQAPDALCTAAHPWVALGNSQYSAPAYDPKGAPGTWH